jgi:hypothetical protein
MDVSEFNELSLADSSFGGIHNVGCTFGSHRIEWIAPC